MKYNATTLRLSFVVLALAALLCGGCAEEEAATPAEVARNVRTLELVATGVTEYFEISGPVEPAVAADVTCEEMGTVVAVRHDKGERVEAGDVLVEIDRRVLEADLESARATLELQQYNYEKTQELFDAGKVSRIEMLTAKQQYESAKSMASIAGIRYERAAVKAPFAGLVADRYVEPGQFVSSVGPVARVIDPFILELNASLTEREVAWVEAGDEALVRLDGHDEVVEGVVHWVAFEADPLNGKFQVEIHLPNDDLALRGGVVGRARLVKTEHPAGIVIPRDAVVADDAGDAVFLVDGDRAQLRHIVLGDFQGLMVAVFDGLDAAEELVVRGQRDLRDGVLVEVTEIATSADGTMAGDPAVVGVDESTARIEAEVEDAR